MIRRDGKSSFVDNLEIGKRGTILKVAGVVPGVPDGTGPWGRGMGPGKGRGDGTGLKVKMEEEKQETPAADTKPEAENVLKKFDKSPEIPQDYINEHVKRIKDGDDPEAVMKDFFKGLQKAKAACKKLTIRTAKAFRQCGIFKMAERDVYQDVDTGDFWKISEDGKSVVRMFKEQDGTTEG